MNVVDLDSQCNPEEVELTSEEIAQSLAHLADQLAANVRSAAETGESFDSVERAVFTSVLKIGFQAMELLLACQGDGDLGSEIQTADEKGNPTLSAAPKDEHLIHLRQAHFQAIHLC